MSFAFELAKPGQPVSSFELNGHGGDSNSHHPKLLTQPRTTHRIRSTAHLSPLNPLNPSSMEDLTRNKSGSISGNTFLSPASRDRRPSEALFNLKGELITLKEEICKLLTDEDRKKLKERQRNLSALISPKTQRTFKDLSEDARHVSHNRAESAQIDYDIVREREESLLSENRALRGDVQALKRKLEDQQVQFQSKNILLYQKIAGLEEAVSRNSADSTSYQSRIAELQQSLQISEQRLHPISEENHSLRQHTQSLMKQLKQKEQNASQQSQTVRKINAELMQTKSELQLKLQEIGQLQAEGNRFRNELDKALHVTMEKQLRIDQLSPQAEQSEQLRTTIRKLESQLSQEASRAMTQLNTEAQALRSQLGEMELSHIATKNELARVAKLAEAKQQEVTVLSEQAAEAQHLRRQLSKLEHESEKSKLTTIDLQQTRSENDTLRKEVQRLTAMVNSMDLAENEASSVLKRQNQLLRDEVDRLKNALTSRQSEYESIASKYYEVVNQASSRNSQETYTSGYYKGEYERATKSLLDKEHEMRELTNSHRREMQRLDEIINQQRQQFVVSDNKLAESQKAVTVLESRMKMLENKEDTSGASLRSENQRLLVMLGEREEEMTRIISTQSRREEALNRAIEQLQQQPVVQRGLYNEKSEKLQALEIENSNLKDELKYLQDEMVVLTNNSRQSQRLVQEINKCNEHYEQQIAAIRASHNRQIEHINSLLDGQRVETDRVCTIVDELNRKLEEKDKEIERIRNESQSNTVKWHELSARSRKASIEMEDLQEKLQSKDDEIDKLKTIRSHLESQLQLQSETLRALQEKLDASQGDSTALLNEQLIKHQQSELSMMEGQLKHHQNTVAELNTEMHQLRQHQEKLQTELRNRTHELELEREELEHLSQSHKQKLHEIASERERWKLSERNNEQSKIISALELQLKKQEQDYEHIIEGLKRQLHETRRAESTLMGSNAGMAELDEALRGQFGELAQVKKDMEKKNAEIFRLKDLVDSTRSNLDNLRSEFEMEKLKHLSEKKNAQVAFDIEQQNLKSDLVSQKRVNESLAQKLKYLNDENKKKDGFIQTYIIGKKLSQDDRFMLKEFFDQYNLEFPRQGLLEALSSDQKHIIQLEADNLRLQQQIQAMGAR